MNRRAERAAMTNPFFTIGHSTRPLPEFVSLLKTSEVRVVVDVRTVPRSRTNPQFNRETLLADLKAREIGYEHIRELGGLRGKQFRDAPSPNSFWENESFRNFADYALTAEFRRGLSRLLALGREARCAIMCAELLWWRCHRRIIADYLIAEDKGVFHIFGSNKIEEATLTPAAHATPDGGLTYY